MKIQKKSGELEEFDRRKLEESIKRAGASPEVVKRVSEKIQPSEGLSTQDLRRRVAEELQRENSALSGAYMSTRTMRTRASPELNSGVARIHAEHLRGLRSDQNALLVHGSKRAEFHIEPTSTAAAHEVHLNKVDLDRLGIQEGTRVALKFPL